MSPYLVGMDAALSLADHDRRVARAAYRGAASGGFGAATIISLWLWPAHPVWSFLSGFCIGAPLGGVASFVLASRGR